MENKNNKTLVGIIITLVFILMGLTAYITYDYAMEKLATEETKENNNENQADEKNDLHSTKESIKLNLSTLTDNFTIPNDISKYSYSIEKESCIGEQLMDSSHFDTFYTKSYLVEANGYKYVSDRNNYEYEYFNDQLITKEINTEIMLSNICNYQGYIFTVENYGNAEDYLKLINSNGEFYEFTGNWNYKNGVLHIYGIDEDSNYFSYNIDLTHDNLEKTNITKEKITCENFDINAKYDENSDEERTKYLHCYQEVNAID